MTFRCDLHDVKTKCEAPVKQQTKVTDFGFTFDDIIIEFVISINETPIITISTKYSTFFSIFNLYNELRIDLIES